MEGFIDHRFAPFSPMPKIPRLHGDIVVTEKIDGTNASVEFARGAEDWFGMAANSRNKRLVEIYWQADREFNPIVKWQGKDNYGFGAFVVANFLKLRNLGYGRHSGEWWGQGIQRTYGLDDRRFSLFNANPLKPLPDCVGVVPVLEKLESFDLDAINMIMAALKIGGSVAAPGFADPEGIVLFHARAGQLLKFTFDAGPKGQKEE